MSEEVKAVSVLDLKKNYENKFRNVMNGVSRKPKEETSNQIEYEQVETIANTLLERTKHRPEIGIICGTGLGGLADQIEDKEVFPYEEIANFPVSTVFGHSGCLVFGTLKGVTVVCMKGRFHPYEGYPMWKCVLPVRVMKLLGVRTLIVTNAAGGLNSSFKEGDIMIIKDHINVPGFCGDSPLRGRNDERWGPRFLPMNNAYDRDLMYLASQCASQLNMQDFIRKGVYLMVGGPTYESVAEAKCLKLFGGDSVGMSTVHEVIAAHHCGMKVLGFSLITNKIIMDHDDISVANHEEVIQVGQKRAKDLEKLVRAIVKKLSLFHQKSSENGTSEDENENKNED